MCGKNHVPGGIAIAGIAVGGIQCLLKSSEVFENQFGHIFQNSPEFLFPNEYGLLLQILIGFVSFCGFIVGTVVPDADHPESMIGRWIYIPVGHRGILHSIWPVLLLLFIGLGPAYLRPFVFFSAGYMAHLICDAFSASGVKFFWPVRVCRHRMKLYVTGETSERVFLFVLIACALALLIGGFFIL